MVTIEHGFFHDVTPRFPGLSVSIPHVRGYDRAWFMRGVRQLWLVHVRLTCCCGYFGSPPYDGQVGSNTACTTDT